MFIDKSRSYFGSVSYLTNSFGIIFTSNVISSNLIDVFTNLCVVRIKTPHRASLGLAAITLKL